MLLKVNQNGAKVVPEIIAKSKSTSKNACRNRYKKMLLFKTYRKPKKWTQGAILSRKGPKELGAGGGSQLPTAIYPHRAAEKRRTRSGMFLRIVCRCLAEAGAVKEKLFNIK